MPSWFMDVLQQAAARVEALPLDGDEKHRLYHFLAFLMVGIPTMLAFGIYNLWVSNLRLGGAIFAMAASILLALGLLPKVQSGAWLYRLNILFYASLLLYMLVLGGEGSSKALWMFTFPLVCFFLLGYVEGLGWTAILLCAAAGVFWVAPSWVAVHRYQGQFTSRFMASFLIVSVLACWFEYLRQHYRKGLEAEQQRLLAERAALQEALSKVKALSGLLPICASCKKVRDDDGYWTQIEAYIRHHSDAEFSHGLCPDCAEHLYPGVYRNSGNVS